MAVAESPIPPAPGYMKTQLADHFTVKYNPEGKVDMTKALKDSAIAYDKIDRFFLGYHNNTTMKIASSNDEYRMITGLNDAPDSIQAVDFNDGGRDTIIIKSPDILPDFGQIMTYHMAKIAERGVLKVYHAPPAWFEEGLAEYVASNITDSDRAYSADLAKQGGWMSLDKIDKIYENTTIYNTNSTDNRNARIQSFLLVEQVGHIYGNLTLLDIFTNFGQQGNLDNAFMKYTGQKPDDFNQELDTIMTGPQTASATTEPDNKTSISGYIFDTGSAPLRNQTITFTGTDAHTTAITDQNGRYETGVLPGILKVRINGTGFDFNDNVSVTPGESKVYNATVSSMEIKDKGQAATINLINLFGTVIIIIADLVAAAIIAYVRRKSVL